ncbi:MAG: hypothetical protein ACMG6S_25515, partial [Byssovorax sp.]
MGRDPGLDLALSDAGRGEITKRLGAVLAKLPDPAATWRSAYRALEPQRRRNQYAISSYEDVESVLLVHIGLYGCARAVEVAGDTETRARMGELFWSLYDAARRLWLTAAMDIGDRKRNLVAVCFAFLPALFGETLGNALARALRPVGNDPWLLARACSYLRLNGVEAEQLARFVAGAGFDLEATLRDAREWSMLTEQKDEFPHDFQELADALGYSLDAPAPPPEAPEARLSRHRSALMNRIPWGKALFDRLAQDGCALTRLEPLDDKAMKWLLQVEVPSSLQHAFGLAPELRILAASGRFDGRTLGQAQDDPQGAAMVDPDLIVVANDGPDMEEHLALLPGAWGQRVPWPMGTGSIAPLADTLRIRLPEFDLFDRRDPVRGRQLIGRRALIAELSSRLVRGQAVGVFGLRKVGKSSLLGAVIAGIDPADTRLAGAETRALVVSLDVQSIAVLNIDTVAQRLVEELRARLDRAGLLSVAAIEPRDLFMSTAAPLAEDPLEELSRLLRLALTRSGLPVCIVMDEYDLLFEGYGGEPGVVGIERLFGLLRALAQETRRVAVAVVGRDPVFLERPLMGGFTSPMLGWAVPFWLGPLRREEADELLTRLGRRVGLELSAETADVAWRWTAGHPLLLRQFGSALLEVARERGGSPGSVPTDPLCAPAIDAFMDRDAVRTIVAEVKALLGSRFPEALSLLQELSEVNGAGPAAALEQHDGWNGDAARVLRNFGLVAGDAEFDEENGATYLPYHSHPA